MGQALLGIGAGAAGAFGPAYDAARKNRQQSQLDDFQIQNAQRDAQAMTALGQLGGGAQALPGIGAGGPPGTQGPPGMPPGMQGPPGMPPPQPPMPQQGPPMSQMRGNLMPMPQGMPQGTPQLGAPPPPGMVNPRMIGNQPQNLTGPTIMPQQAPSAGLTPAAAPGGAGPPSSSLAPPGGLRGREQLDPSMQGRGQMPQVNTVRWDQAMQMIASKNPGIKPDVLMRATDMFMQKFGDKQNIMDWREQQVQFKEQQIASRERMATEAAQMKFQLAGMTDERIRDIAQGNADLKLRLESQRENARREIVETQQAGATERTGMQTASREGIAARAQEGAYERTSLQQRGAAERQATGIESREGIAARAQEGAYERTSLQQRGAAERTGMTIAGRAADTQAKLDAAMARLKLTDNTKREMGMLSDATKREIAANADLGKDRRQQFSVTAKKEIATLNNEAKAELQKTGIIAKEELQQTGIEAAGARQDKAIEAGRERQEGKQQFTREERQETEQFKTQVQQRNLDAMASRQEKALAARVSTTGAAHLNSEDTDTLAKSIAEYRQPPYAGTRSGDAMKVMARVHQLNPAYDASVWGGKNDAMKKFAAGPEGRTVRSLNVANFHLDTLVKLQQAMNNSDYTGANKIINAWKKTFGYAAPVAFDLAKQTVASEVVKAVSGMSGGGQKERMEAAQNIANHLNDTQFSTSVAGLKELLSGQTKGLQIQYKAATGLNDFDRFLFKSDASSSEGGPVKVGTPAEAAKLPPGTHYITPDGREFTR